MSCRIKPCQTSRRARGVAAIHFILILTPVLLGLIGFAVDLGMLYSVKGELKTAAGALALAAAQQLNGTDAGIAAATTAAQIPTNNYYFAGYPVGQTTGALTSTTSGPDYFDTAADALATSPLSSNTAGATAQYVRVTVTGQIQLLFWSFLPIVNDRRVTVQASAVAGISAPLCEACAIEPITAAAIDTSDTKDFGFVAGTLYSFAYLCSPGASPPVLAPGTRSIPYVLLNRFNPNYSVFPDEGSQAFQDGAIGLPGNTSSAQACFRVNNTELLWTDATVNSCSAPVAAVVSDALCGLETRFETPTAAVCSSVPTSSTLTAIYAADTDITADASYTDYTGNGRRILTFPIVDSLSSTAEMTVLGFRQFLLIPAQTAPPSVDPTDRYGRFVAMYIGSVAPVAQGRFDGCTQSAGPGKVVLHQ